MTQKEYGLYNSSDLCVGLIPSIDPDSVPIMPIKSNSVWS